jgi:hypothetical protein
MTLLVLVLVVTISSQAIVASFNVHILIMDCVRVPIMSCLIDLVFALEVHTNNHRYQSMWNTPINGWSIIFGWWRKYEGHKWLIIGGRSIRTWRTLGRGCLECH